MSSDINTVGNPTGICIELKCNNEAVLNLPRTNVKRTSFLKHRFLCLDHHRPGSYLPGSRQKCTECKTRKATFGVTFGIPISCIICKDDDHWAVRHDTGKPCITDGCFNRPIYKSDASNKPKVCEDHKNEEYYRTYDLNFNKCIYQDSNSQCSKVSNFKDPKVPDSKPRYCKEHIPDKSYINNSPKCQGYYTLVDEKKVLTKCSKNATKRIATNKSVKPTHCAKCIKKITDESTTILRSGKTCSGDNCIKQPGYNYAGHKAKYCADHKLKFMVRVSNTCKTKGCTKIPSFGPDGKSIVCKNCNSKNWPLIFFYKCVKCRIRANYAPPDSKIPSRCRNCVEEGDIDIMSKRCNYGGCDVIASYGNNGTAATCSNHNYDKCKNIFAKYCQYTDDKNKNGCGKIASKKFKKNDIWTYCAEHAPEGCNITRATICKCGNQVSFGIPGQSITCCSLCKTIKMIRRSKNKPIPPPEKCKRCTNMLLYYEIKCTSCNTLRPTREKKAEMKVYEFLMTNEIKFIHDKTPRTDPHLRTKYRPDFQIKTPHGTIVVEVDEHQHKHTTYCSEDTRMIEIHHALKSNTLFIRYNPHNYILKKGSKNKYSAKNRLKYLLKTINKYQAEEFTGVTAIYLFYDGFDSRHLPAPVISIITNTDKIAS